MKNRVTPFVDTKNTDKVIRLARPQWIIAVG